MTKADLVRSVRKAAQFLRDMKLTEYPRQYEPLPVIEGFRDLALGGAKTYEELYLGAIRTLAYNVMLRDFSLFQFSKLNGDLRYAFLPNPFLGFEDSRSEIEDAWAAVADGEIDIEDAMQVLANIEPIGQRPPQIRYEMSEVQRVQLRHPCAHFHIGFHTTNRWPVRRALTPYAFTLLIVKLYYGSAWLEKSGTNQASEHENLLIRERQDECRELDLENFSELEKQSFHFA